MNIKDFLLGYEAGVAQGGGGNGGGGSFPTGLYWKDGGITMPTKYHQQWFSLNGEQYAIATSYSGAGNWGDIYKYTNGAWAKIITGTSANKYPATIGGMNIVEYNGKVHMAGGETKRHKVFDGVSVTSMNDLPAYCANRSMFVHNNTLKYYSYDDGSVYAWDETSDTWTVEATIASSYTYINFAVDNKTGNAYCTKSLTIYKYNGAALEEIGLCSKWGTALGIHNGNLYYRHATYSYTPDAVYRFNIATGIETLIGFLPSGYEQCSAYVHEGTFRVVLGSDELYFSEHIMYDIETA